MLTTSAIFQGADQNILTGATITSSIAPVGSYPLEVLSYLRPDWRVRFGSGTVTITFALDGGSPADALGDIFVLPMSNLVDGHVTLTNDAGLSQNIPVPATRRNGLPKTIVVDLSVLEPNATIRTSDTWHLVISGNPVNVTLGGAIAIYSPKTALGDRDFQWGYTVRSESGVDEVQNRSLSRFRVDRTTVETSIDLQTLCTDADADALQGFFDGSHGRGLTGLLWLTPEVEDAYLGILPKTFERIVGSELVPDTNIIRFTFTELSKGKPLL